MNPRKKIILYLFATLGAYLLFLFVLILGGAPVASLEQASVLAAFFLGLLFLILFDGLLRKDRYEVEMHSSEFLELGTLAPVFENVDHGVVSLDVHRIVVSANAAALRLFDIEEKSFVGRPFGAHFEIRSSRTRQLHFSFIEDAFRQGKVFCTQEETYIVSARGREIPVSLIATPVVRENKKTTGVILSLHDLTAENQARISRKKTKKVQKTGNVDKRGKTRG